MKTKTIFNWASLAALAVFLAGGCGDRPSEKQVAPETVRVPLYTAELKELPVFTTAMGTLEPFSKAQLATRIMVHVKEVRVEAGDRVKAGQVLVELDQKDITSRLKQSEAMLASAKSQRENARSYFNRIKKLHDEQSATDQALDNARTQLESAEAAVLAAEGQVSEAQANLNYSRLVAPFDGYVTAKSVEPGDMANPGVPLVTVEQQDSMKIVATVSVGQNRHHRLFQDACERGSDNPLGRPAHTYFPGETGTRQSRRHSEKRDVRPGVFPDRHHPDPGCARQRYLAQGTAHRCIHCG